MFTFGREHEKKCAASYCRSHGEAQKLLSVIDAVHDLIDCGRAPSEVLDTFRVGFTEGGVRAWEGTGTWLRKSGPQFPELLSLWEEFACHRSAHVRFRVACFLNEMPSAVSIRVVALLSNDRSSKVAGMVQARLEESAAKDSI